MTTQVDVLSMPGGVWTMPRMPQPSAQMRTNILAGWARERHRIHRKLLRMRPGGKKGWQINQCRVHRATDRYRIDGALVLSLHDAIDYLLERAAYSQSAEG